MINVQEIKNQILNFLKENGPSLPIHISRHVKLSPMFSSAILAELSNEKRINISSLKIGSSPLYFLPGDEEKLEKYADENFTGVQKSAFLKLKENKIIEDKTQEPSIRVALRSIKDFATPFNLNNEMFWRYNFASREEIQKIIQKKEKTFVEKPVAEISEKKVEPIFENVRQDSQEENFNEEKVEKPKKEKKQKTNFLEEIKEFLQLKNIELLNTIQIDKKEITAKIKIQGKEHLLVAYAKKRVSEKDILKAYKKASALNLPYYILCQSELTKKMQETIDAYQSLFKVDKID